MQEKLDESNANCVRIENVKSEQNEQLVGLEREIETLHQQITVSFGILYTTLFHHDNMVA